jgi:hypothetical protein
MCDQSDVNLVNLNLSGHAGVCLGGAGQAGWAGDPVVARRPGLGSASPAGLSKGRVGLWLGWAGAGTRN